MDDRLAGDPVWELFSHPPRVCPAGHLLDAAVGAEEDAVVALPHHTGVVDPVSRTTRDLTERCVEELIDRDPVPAECSNETGWPDAL
jgi:hypothetical protein